MCLYVELKFPMTRWDYWINDGQFLFGRLTYDNDDDSAPKKLGVYLGITKPRQRALDQEAVGGRSTRSAPRFGRYAVPSIMSSPFENLLFSEDHITLFGSGSAVLGTCGETLANGHSVELKATRNRVSG